MNNPMKDDQCFSHWPSVCFLLNSQEQIYDFYETLRNGPGDSIEQFQSILEVFVCDILKHRKEIKRLEESYKR